MKYKVFFIGLLSLSAYCNCIDNKINNSLLDSLSLTNSKPIYYSSANVQDLQKNKITFDERSGCCSHHQGVCGCSYGRAVCCDGTLSPSCGCD